MAAQECLSAVARGEPPLNRDEALVKFVREHHRELTGSGATRQIVKMFRQAFFERHRLSAAARFSNYDVAMRIVADVARAKRAQPSQEIKSVLNSIPFVVDEIREEEIDLTISAQTIREKSHLSVEDLRRLREEEYLATVEGQFREKALAEAETKLETDREELRKMKSSLLEKQHAMDAYRSELDSIAPEVALETLVEREEGVHPDRPIVIWWKELGLESDPLSRNQGLFGIPETKYDDVVVQTPFVKAQLQRLDRAPEELLGKTIVILGAFGSGKTTLLQLIAHRSGRLGILPVLTFLNPEAATSRLMTQFASQIMSGVGESQQQRVDDALLQPVSTIDDIGLCIRSMAAVAKATSSIGFLICVDGLHKPESYQKRSLEFLQQLQNFQERLSHSKVQCCILVAGSLAWETELAANPSLSGSFYAVEKVPPLSEDSAVEAVVRRIHSFVPADTPRPTIVKAPLRRAFQVLSKRLFLPPTFRDYLDHIRDRFIGREYASVGISLALHMETIETVHREVETSPLGAPYHRLASRPHAASFKRVMKRILPEIYARKGILESDPLFRANHGAFALLRKEGFIVPRLSGDKRQLVWHLSVPVVDFLEKAFDQHKIPPADALEAMFSELVESLPQEAETIYGPVRKRMSSMAASWRPGWPEVANLLEQAASSAAAVEKASETLEGLTHGPALEKLQSSLRNLMEAVAFVLGGKEWTGGTKGSQFGRLWCAPENSDSWEELLQRTAPLPRNLSECFGILHRHAQALGDLCVLLSDLIRGEGVSRLSGRLLTREELAKLHEARTLFLSQQYAETVDALCGVLEPKLRDVIYVVGRCIMGDRLPSIIPEDIRPQLGLVRGHPRAKRQPDENFLYSISRSEYTKVIFQREFSKALFDGVVSRAEVEEAKQVLELLFSLGDREAHRDRPAYFREHSTEIADSLKATPRVCELTNRLAERLLVGTGFVMRKLDDRTMECAFGAREIGFKPFRLDASEVEASVYELLSGLETAGQSLPPFDTWISGIRLRPEAALAILRGSVEQALVGLYRRSGPEGFALELSITAKGKERLAALAGRHTG